MHYRGTIVVELVYDMIYMIYNWYMRTDGPTDGRTWRSWQTLFATFENPPDNLYRGLTATKRFCGFCDGDKVTGASPTQAVRSDVVVFVVHLSRKWIQAKITAEICGLRNMGRRNSGHAKGNRKQDWCWEHRLQAGCMSCLYEAGLAACVMVIRHQSTRTFHLRELFKRLRRNLEILVVNLNDCGHYSPYITRSCNTGHYKMANAIFIGL
jgi:hypothetical protein